MILHFIKEDKFSDILIENFSILEAPQTWFFFGAEGFEGLNLMKYRGKNIVFANTKDRSIKDIIGEINPEYIVLHSLNEDFARVLLSIERRVPVTWIVWGYGLYTLPKLKYLQYSPRTKSWLRTQHRFGEFKNSLKSFSFFRKLHQLWKPESIDSEGKKLKALEKIDFFSTNIKEDFDVFCRHYDHPLEFLSFHNAHIEQIVGHTKNARIHPDASYILIGNSNTPTCNYHDAIDLVETYGPKGMKAYIIASYGDNEAYRSEITRYAASQKLVEFEMITDFMPLKEYITLLQNCSVGVFHHYRQQAMNNIIAMLYMGARVYLCERNPVYKYLRRHQINVFSIEKDVPILGFTRLEESPALENRKILEDVFSYENMVKSIHNWFETVKRINDKQFL